jgi:hypothetical protein
MTKLINYQQWITNKFLFLFTKTTPFIQVMKNHLELKFNIMCVQFFNSLTLLSLTLLFIFSNNSSWVIGPFLLMDMFILTKEQIMYFLIDQFD